MFKSTFNFRPAIYAASTAIALVAPAAAQTAATGAIDGSVIGDAPMIVPSAPLVPNQPPPNGILDLGITGIGQMVIDAGGGSVGLCTGSLINPRTVIFAAHCANTRPASAYGGNEGGTGMGFFFEDNTLAGIRRWLGLDGGIRYASDPSRNYFNVNQLWYDPRSLALGPTLNFLQGDVAIATLDARADSIPTWALLFSPVEGEVHVTMVGYGNTGSGLAGANQSGGFRRRAVENMLSALASLDERNDVLFGPAAPFLVQSLYQTDFDNPLRTPGTVTNFDFDLFRGAALPREGTTAPGDSGGPLIVDQAYDRQVVAGVLSGGSRFFGAQPFSSYGTSSFYQPLFLFWDVIVENNPYVYANTTGGDGEWTDPGHWVQAMDPNYTVLRNGELVNGLPGARGLGVSGDTPTFGNVCFVEDCVDLAPLSVDLPAGTGGDLVIPGGPGSGGFVPNNIEPNRLTGTKARYYDVTLNNAGRTGLSADVTIDAMTLDHADAKLDVRSDGSLSVVGDYNQFGGWTNVDGSIAAREMLFLTGLLSGNGTLNTPWATVGAVIVAPGGADDIGTLSVNGNMILSSGAALFVDANRFGADKLAVSGLLDINGTALVMNKAKGAAPRHGDAFTIATAGDINGAFGDIYAFQGVLRPELSYSDTAVVAKLRAGSLANQIGQSGPIERAFAEALDTLREDSYFSLYNLFGNVDLMDPQQLSSTLRGLAPTRAADTFNVQDLQSRKMIGTVSDRLSMLGRDGGTEGFEVIGSPQHVAMLGANEGSTSLSAAQMALTHGLVVSNASLPDGVSGFISGGVTGSRSMLANTAEFGGQQMVHMSMGLEFEVADRVVIGSSVGQAYSISGLAEDDRAENSTTQVAVYGAWRLDGGAYLAGLTAAETSRADINRTTSSGNTLFDLTGASNSERYSVMAETGVNLPVGDSFEVTPNASIGWSSNRIGGFRERGGELALLIDDIDVEQFEARLGFQFAGDSELASGWSVRPQFQAEAVQLLSGASDDLTVRFASARDVGIALPLLNGDRSWGEVKGGLHLTNGVWSIGAELESTVGRGDFEDNRAVGQISLRF